MAFSVLMGACMVLMILLLRGLFPRLPRRILVLLWTGALLVLLTPGVFSTPFSIYGLLPEALFLQTGAAGLSRGLAARLLPGFWPVLRRSVAALALLFFLITYCAGLLRLRRARVSTAPAVRDWQASHPLLRPLRICVGQVAAPVCGGILFPRIVLPEDADLSDREELDCVLTHEYVHIYRLDTLLKPLIAVGLCLRWYDPLVWITALAAVRDMEYACDEAVLDAGISRKRYAAALLRAALRRADRLPAAVRFNAGQTERRVDRICAHRPRSSLCWLAAGVLALGLLTGFGTAPKAAEAAAPEPAPPVFMESGQLGACAPDAWTWDPTFPATGETPVSSN